MKRCYRCGQRKSLEQFPANRSRRDGLSAECRRCVADKQRDFRRKHPGYDRARERRRLLRAFGLSVADFDALATAQNDCCAICGKPERVKLNGKTLKRLSVDHDHVTGRIRALLCSQCNHVLGMVYEDTALLRRFIAYIEKYRLIAV